MPMTQEVLDRLLLAKFLLGQLRAAPVASPDRLSLARQILTAHDAAELAIAGVAAFLDCLPPSPKTFLMDYFPSIQDKTGADVPGRDFFSALNRARVGIKHHGDFPNLQQWLRVGDSVYRYLGEWCTGYLQLSLDALDESALIRHPDARRQINAAKELRDRGLNKEALECIAIALHGVLRDNPALRNISVGSPRADDAIKLAAFGVHANDFIAIQEFLPVVSAALDGRITIRWKQEPHGHPANWNQPATDFCLRTFVHVAVRIQDAEWIPGALEFLYVYEHKVTAVTDGVELFQWRPFLPGLAPDRRVVRTLARGEYLLGRAYKGEKTPLAHTQLSRAPEVIQFLTHDGVWGEFEGAQVQVTCVPRDIDFVRTYCPGLPEIPWEPSE